MAEEAKQKRTICKGQFTRAEKLLTGAMKDGVAIATIQKRFEAEVERSSRSSRRIHNANASDRGCQDGGGGGAMA